MLMHRGFNVHFIPCIHIYSSQSYTCLYVSFERNCCFKRYNFISSWHEIAYESVEVPLNNIHSFQSVYPITENYYSILPS